MTERYFYIIRNLRDDLNGRIVCMNTQHESHHNLVGPIEGSEIKRRWLIQEASTS